MFHYFLELLLDSGFIRNQDWKSYLDPATDVFAPRNIMDLLDKPGTEINIHTSYAFLQP